MFRVDPTPHEKTKWGELFAIVGPDGEIVGIDRRKPASERCAALNAETATRH